MEEQNEHRRLGDLILDALELAIEQRDEVVAALLLQALDLAMTRGAGGKGFTERRSMPPAIARALERLEALRRDKQAH
ncbi:MAG TPA: hypothetical protein DDX54_05220 [Rhodospirillaceae bacterium]|jgi:hypothetical protein|nr:hypothetical protein [Alphaproteobacteria bacterium]HBH26782.1 hypothetical protein [Rhodospirillaceae bacterium]